MKQKRKTMTTKTSGTEERNASGAQVNENGKDAKAKKDLHSLLETGLKDIYSAEQQLVAALPEVAQAVDNEELEEAINRHLEQTKKHVSRLEKVFERLGISKTQDEKCMAMKASSKRPGAPSASLVAAPCATRPSSSAHKK